MLPAHRSQSARARAAALSPFAVCFAVCRLWAEALPCVSARGGCERRGRAHCSSSAALKAA